MTVKVYVPAFSNYRIRTLIFVFFSKLHLFNQKPLYLHIEVISKCFFNEHLKLNEVQILVIRPNHLYALHIITQKRGTYPVNRSFL